MKAALVLIIVLLSGCATFEGVVDTLTPVFDAGKEILGPAAEKLPEAVDIVANNPGAGGLVEAGIFLGTLLLAGGAAYARKKMKKAPDAPKPE